MPDLVRVKLDDGTEKTVGASFAKSHGLTVIDKPTMVRGRVAPDKRPVDLRGAALDAALEAVGLSTGGTADARRQRLTDHRSSVAQSAVGTTQSLEGDN